MSSSEKTAGCEMALTAAPGEPASLDKERDNAQAVLHGDIECVLPNLRQYARSLTHDAVDADDLIQECLARGSPLEGGNGFESVALQDPPQRICQSDPPRAARQGTTVGLQPVRIEPDLPGGPDRALGNSRPGASAEITTRTTTRGGPDDQFDKRLLRGHIGLQSACEHHTISPFAWPEDPPRANERGPFRAAHRQPLREDSERLAETIV
jgi:hypothetical protein